MKKKTRIDSFIKERESLNELVLKKSGRNIKRFFTLDTQVYDNGEIPKKYKELIGLTSSMVLRCDDCVNYHLLQCAAEGVSDTELDEALSIALIIGGSITIPHIRRAMKSWEEITASGDIPKE